MNACGVLGFLFFYMSRLHGRFEVADKVVPKKKKKIMRTPFQVLDAKVMSGN